MLVLLPPSETKRRGGEGPPLALDRLAHPTLTTLRSRVVDALVDLSGDEEESARTLRLGKTQLADIGLNAVARVSPTMAAVDRYTGVLFDALDARGLDDDSRAWLAAHVQIHSAPFGPVGAMDGIPAYRMSAAVSLPSLGSSKRLWSGAVSDALAEAAPDFVLDLRSEAYVALGPVPGNLPSSYVRVVASGPDGTVRALNHFNKHAKGELVRRLATSAATIAGSDDLLSWAAASDVDLRRGEGGDLLLFSD